MDLAAWFGPVNLGLVLLILTMLLRNLQNFQLMQTFVARQLNRRARRLAVLIDPYLSITIHEYDADRMTRCDVFAETKTYFDGAVGSRDCARHLSIEDARGDGGSAGGGGSSSKKLVLSMADGEEVSDHFRGATLW